MYFETGQELAELPFIANLTKLTLTDCKYFGEVPLALPLHIKKLVINANYIDPIYILDRNMTQLEYIKVDNITDELLLYIIMEFKNIYLHTNFELSSFSMYTLYPIHVLIDDNNNIIINREDFFYKPSGELDNYCFNCLQDENHWYKRDPFNNDIAEMTCVKCNKPLENTNSLIP